MREYIDFQRFYACLDTKAGHMALGKLAKEIGVSLSALRAMLDGDFTRGLFDFNNAACGAFFKTCEWMGVPASDFLVDQRVLDARSELTDTLWALVRKLEEKSKT